MFVFNVLYFVLFAQCISRKFSPPVFLNIFCLIEILFCIFILPPDLPCVLSHLTVRRIVIIILLSDPVRYCIAHSHLKCGK